MKTGFRGGWIGSLLALGVAALLSTVFLPPAVRGQAAKPEVTAVAIGVTADPQIGGPWVIAREKRFFAMEGLPQGEVKIFPSGPASFPAFVSGELQGNDSSEQAMLTQAAAGVRLKLVAVYSDITGVHGMLGSANVKTAKDLEGKAVGLQKGSSAEWYTRNFCKVFGCDISKVKILNMPPAEGVTALVNGNIDGYSSWQPFLNRALEAGKGKGLHYLHYNNTSFVAGAEGPKKIETSYGVFYVPSAFLEKNPRTVDAMLRVLDRAVTFINANQTEAAKILAAEFKQSETDMEGQVRAVKYALQIDDERVRDIQAVADLLLAEKLVKDRVDFAKTLLETAPLKRVKPDAVTFGG
ncbi:MAG TPA: ABC transporter substrate-binding protein [Candidatus Methylomirabilis sp.]|nr:ABC transporter substrate-binding protein [Candidatus Methylomirabilis sp.]